MSLQAAPGVAQQGFKAVPGVSEPQVWFSVVIDQRDHLRSGSVCPHLYLEWALQDSSSQHGLWWRGRDRVLNRNKLPTSFPAAPHHSSASGSPLHTPWCCHCSEQVCMPGLLPAGFTDTTCAKTMTQWQGSGRKLFPERFAPPGGWHSLALGSSIPLLDVCLCEHTHGCCLWVCIFSNWTNGDMRESGDLIAFCCL